MERAKKIFRGIAAVVCTAVITALPLTASANTSLFPGGAQQPSGGTSLDGLWTFNDYGNGTFSVSCNDKTLVHAEVPETINGKKVTMIELDCFKDNTVLETVTLPNTITHIEDWSFSGCTSLRSVNLPNSLERIDWQAFYGCSALEEINIPAGVTLIDKFVFEGCNSMKAVNVSDGNHYYTDVDGVLFDYAMMTLLYYPSAKEDKTFDIPDTCTKIEDWAFVGNTYLETIDLTGITEIGEDAFYYCTALKSIAIPEGISELKSATFGSCYELTDVTLPSTLDIIGEYAFYNCLALDEIVIPGRVDTIGSYAFLNCPNLKTIALNDAVTTIGEYALGFFQDEETMNLTRLPDFVVDTHSETEAHRYCVRYDIKSTGGVTQSSVFIVIMIIIIVLVIAATIAIIIVQHRIKKRYELR